jgi:hypothetical protein
VRLPRDLFGLETISFVGDSSVHEEVLLKAPVV